jgi:hypothetical protein
MRRPRAWFAATHPGGPGTPPGGHYDPSARSFAGLGLRPMGFRRGLRGKTGAEPLLQEPAETWRRNQEARTRGLCLTAKAGGAKPRWSAERRPRFWQQERGKTERLVRRSVLHPLALCEGERREEGKTADPAPKRIRALALGCLTTESVAPHSTHAEERETLNSPARRSTAFSARTAR